MKKRAIAVLVTLASADVAPHDDARHAEECLAGVKLDCVVSSEWSVAPNFGFGACSTTCGQGQSTRVRTIVHDACNDGKPCPRLTQTEECMVGVCQCTAVHCKYETHVCTTTDMWKDSDGSTGGARSYYDSGAVVTGYDDATATNPGHHLITGIGVGTFTASSYTSAADLHSGSAQCDASDPLRVYHPKGGAVLPSKNGRAPPHAPGPSQAPPSGVTRLS